MNGIWLKTGPHFNIKRAFSPGTLHRTTHYKDSWLWYRLIFITGIPILIRLHLYTETASRALHTSLPNSLGQVKLPVGKVDLDKNLFKILYDLQYFKTRKILKLRRGSHLHIIQVFPPEKKKIFSQVCHPGILIKSRTRGVNFYKNIKKLKCPYLMNR